MPAANAGNVTSATSAREIQRARGFVEDRVGVLNRGPRVVGYRCDRGSDQLVEADRDRDLSAGADRGADGASSAERRVNPHHLAVLACPGFNRAAPTDPGTSRDRLPSTAPPCCDRTTMKVSHLHSSCQRLTAHVDRGLAFLIGTFLLHPVVGAQQPDGRHQDHPTDEVAQGRPAQRAKPVQITEA